MKVIPTVCHRSTPTRLGSAQVPEAEPVRGAHAQFGQVIVERPRTAGEDVAPHHGYSTGRHQERHHERGPWPSSGRSSSSRW